MKVSTSTFMGSEQRSRISGIQWMLLCGTLCTSPNIDSVALAPSLAEFRITWYSCEISTFLAFLQKSYTDPCKSFYYLWFAQQKKIP